MISDIFKKYKLEYFAFVSSVLCTPANRRLYNSLTGEGRVIFVLFPYFTGQIGAPLSRFAAVYDYHGFAELVLGDVCRYILEKYPNESALHFSDHSPFAEVSGAAAAGLGLIGTNGLLINEKYSSFVCIGEIFTTLDPSTLTAEGVRQGSGIAERCEDCKRCVEACPGCCAGTDSRDTCVSAVNQKKGELTDTQKQLIERSGYVWGCDICQSVCPHTLKALENGTVETPVEYFRKGAIGDAVSEIRALSEDEYKKYPFSWRKREIMDRNIEILLKGGNTGD